MDQLAPVLEVVLALVPHLEGCARGLRMSKAPIAVQRDSSATAAVREPDAELVHRCPGRCRKRASYTIPPLDACASCSSSFTASLGHPLRARRSRASRRARCSAIGEVRGVERHRLAAVHQRSRVVVPAAVRLLVAHGDPSMHIVAAAAMRHAVLQARALGLERASCAEEVELVAVAPGVERLAACS